MCVLIVFSPSSFLFLDTATSNILDADTIEQESIERATVAFQLPLSPVRSIRDVKRSPIKTKVSFVGHLVTVSNQVFKGKI